jgi:hypothetical protein
LIPHARAGGHQARSSGLCFLKFGEDDALLVSIRDCRHSKKDRQWIQDVYGEYIESLADLNTGLFSVIGADNPREDEIFANWFSNDHSHPLVILKGPDPVGFALVTRPRIPAAGFAGDWLIVEYLRNPGSVAFWRRVVAGYCGAGHTERTRHGEVQQRFKSGPAALR